MPDNIETVEEIVSTPHSYVLRLKTVSDAFYLKMTPPDLFIEAETLEVLHAECNVTLIPKIIAADKKQNCFLSTSCGDNTLRNLFAGKIDVDLTIKAIEHFKHIQKETTPHIETFLKIGVPDWRLDKFSQLFNEMVDDTALLKEWGLNQDEIRVLEQSKLSFKTLCSALASYEFPDTLNHSDFQDGNMLINEASQEITFIDWGETNIGFPLFPIASCLHGIKDRYDISPKSDAYKKLQNKLFDGVDIKKKDKEHIMPIIDTLAAVYYVFTLKDLMKRTQQAPPHLRGRCKSALHTFIEKQAQMDVAYFKPKQSNSKPITKALHPSGQ